MPATAEPREDLIGHLREQIEADAEGYANAKAQAVAARLAGRVGKRALVADDNPRILSLHTAGLESLGFRVTTAFCGREAKRALFDGDQPRWPGTDLALVVLDNQMAPRPYGIDILRRIRATDAGPALPAIICTADWELADEAHALGAAFHPKGTAPNYVELVRDAEDRARRWCPECPA